MEFEEHQMAECEALLRAVDRCAAVEFRLLPRFFELPACDDLIDQQLRQECPEDFRLVEADRDAFFPDQDGGDDDEEDDDDAPDGFPAKDEDNDAGADAGGGPSDPGTQASPALDDGPQSDDLKSLDKGGKYILDILFSTMFDWCNINVMLLEGDDLPRGMAVSFYLARAVTFLNYSMTESMSLEPTYGLVHARRCLHFINLAVGEMQAFGDRNEQVRDIVASRLPAMYSVVDSMEDQLQILRRIGS